MIGKNIGTAFHTLGWCLGVVVVILVLIGLSWGFGKIGDKISLNQDTSRQKRIEAKLEEMDGKLDKLIEIGNKWE